MGAVVEASPQLHSVDMHELRSSPGDFKTAYEFLVCTLLVEYIPASKWQQ